MRPAWIGILGAAAIAVPAFAAPASAGSAAPGASRAASTPAPVQHYVDLNSASRKELMTLPGIGQAEAAKIIANRPYLTKTELVSKNVLAMGPFLSLKHLVVAMPKTAPKGKA